MTTGPALPPENHPTWARLIEGTIRHEFSYAAAGVLLFNLNIQWRRDPSRLPLLIQQARAFLQKYQHLLIWDLQKLFA